MNRPLCSSHADAVRCVATARAAVVALLLAAAVPAPAWDDFLILTSDYSAHGSVAVAQRRAPWGVTPDLQPVGSDAVARYHDGLYYVVNRGGDSNLQILDPADGLRTVRQFSLGAGRNPQDIAFAPSGLAYISCYDAPVLLRVDPAVGAVLQTISTQQFADADGLPETGWMLAVGDLLYIACQRLNRNNWYLPADVSLLLVYDMEGQAWVDCDPATPGVQGITLAGTNPSCRLELSADRARLRIGCTGWYGLLDGGVEAVDLAARASLGFIVTEAALGGDLLDFATTGPSRGFAVVSDAAFITSVRRYDPSTGGDVAVVLSGNGFVHAGLAHDGFGLLYVADRTLGAAGLRVFDAEAASELTAASRPTGLPPGHIVLPVEAQLTGAGDPVALPGRALRLSPPAPNPANPGCEVAVFGPPDGVVPIAVLDLRGRRLRADSLALDAGGQGRFRFDGRDGAGRSLPSGVYRVRAGQGRQAAECRVTVAR